MTEGQSRRRIGTGMKPRGKKQVKPQKEKNPMTDPSTTEGHDTPLQEAVLDPQEGNETPGNLEPENGEKPLQNLENSEAMVAQDEGLGEPSAAGEELLKALVESGGEGTGEVIDAEFEDVDEPTADLEAATAVGSGTVREIHREPIKNLDAKIEAAYALGLQPDGSTKVIVTIQEGYWEAVQQWAEADGVAVERWLSDRLYEYISTYGEPAKGR